MTVYVHFVRKGSLCKSTFVFDFHVNFSYLLKLVNLTNEEISVAPLNFCVGNVNHVLK